MKFYVCAVMKDPGLFRCVSKNVLLIFGLFLVQDCISVLVKMERKCIFDMLNVCSLTSVSTTTESSNNKLHAAHILLLIVHIDVEDDA